MKTTVVITKMSDNSEQKKEFATEHEAIQYYKKWCDEHGYEYDEKFEAGGIGFNYRIELE